MMLRNDLIYHPTHQVSKANMTKIKADFESNTYDIIQEEELLQVLQ